jgi:hypothetical protein
MLVFYKERLVFLSVPKTGTTAYQSALAPHADIVVSDPPILKHAPVYRYNRFFRPMFEKACNVEMELLAVMREPVSWLGSWYRYRQRPFMKGKANATFDLSFDDFVQGYIKGRKPAFADVGSQAKFLEPHPSGCHVTHLFRYEDQSGLRAFLEDRLDLSISLGAENVSPKLPLDLSADTRAALLRKCSQEFDLYNSIPVRGDPDDI